jgi:hypothetical protein
MLITNNLFEIQIPEKADRIIVDNDELAKSKRILSVRYKNGLLSVNGSLFDYIFSENFFRSRVRKVLDIDSNCVISKENVGEDIKHVYYKRNNQFCFARSIITNGFLLSAIAESSNESVMEELAIYARTLGAVNDA